jgi:hypothetical protein
MISCLSFILRQILDTTAVKPNSSVAMHDDLRESPKYQHENFVTEESETEIDSISYQGNAQVKSVLGCLLMVH